MIYRSERKLYRYLVNDVNPWYITRNVRLTAAMQTAHTPRIYELIQYGEWLQEYFTSMGYTLKEVFNIDFDNSHLVYIRTTYENRSLTRGDFQKAVKKLEEIIKKYETEDYELPEKDKLILNDNKFYDYVKKYWCDYGELPLDKIKNFYKYRRPCIKDYALKDFKKFAKEIKLEKEIEFPTLTEIQKLKEERAISHRSAGNGRTMKMSVYDRPAITEHTFSLEEFFKENDTAIYPYLEPHEYYAIVKPLLKLSIKIVVVKAIINHQLVNVILMDQDMADEDFAHYVTYMRKKIPTEYWDTLYIKKINEYDLLSFRDNLSDLELIYEAADKQYKNPSNWYGIERPVGTYLKPIKLFSLWMRTKDGVNGMLMITTNPFIHVTQDVKKLWKRVDLEDVITQRKMERGIEIYHDFELLSFENVIRDIPETETLYILEIPIKECFLIPKIKKELERQHATILPWHELQQKTTSVKRVINKDEGDNKHIDYNSMTIIGKYFEYFKDFVNLEKTCKEYRGIINIYHYNPVPLRKNQMKLFTNIEKYFYYTKGKPDFYLHILKQNDEQWQWNQTHLGEIARGSIFPTIINGQDSLVREFKLKDNINLPDEPTEDLLSIDLLEQLFEKWKTYEPRSEDE